MANIDFRLDNLPAQLTSFVGRQKELAQIKQFVELKTSRLYNITGAGGSGKTRLALEAARQLKGYFKDGVWFVELAALTNPKLVSQQIAQLVGLREQPDLSIFATLVNHLKNRSLLLILDNCEHLLETCANLCEKLLQECPELVIIVTSRESFRIQGETVMVAQPLTVPAHQQITLLSLDELAITEAVQLFLQRGQAVQPSFKLTKQNRAEVVQLCQSLDGLPLALELAAARLRGLSITQLVSRLESNLGARFQLLNQGSRTTLPRHQSLEGLLQWSYERLTERERVVLRRISVFAGGFPLAGAEAVCQGSFETANGQGQIEPGELLDLLSELINKSLLQADESAKYQVEPRYWMLETIRQYSLEKATQSGESNLFQHRQLLWCLEFAELAEPYLQGPDQANWLNQLEHQHSNFRVALEWALNNEKTEHALRLGGALWRFWQARSYFEEGRYWLQKILAQSNDLEVKPEIKAKALQGAGVLFSLWDYPTSLVFQDENLKLRRAMGDQAGLTSALKDLGWLALHYNDFARAKVLAEESLKLAREMEDKVAIAAALFILSIAAYFENHISQANRWCDECLDLCQSLGDVGSVASGLHHRGKIAIRQADYQRARQALLESLHLNWKLGNKLGLANNIIDLIELGVVQPEQPQGLVYAVFLLGWLSSFDAELGGKMPPLARQSFEASLLAGRTRLDETVFQKFWAQGSLLTLEQAFELAQQAGLSPSSQVEKYQSSTDPREKRFSREFSGKVCNSPGRFQL